MKKFLAICLSLCLAAALLAVPVLAEGETKEVENADALKKAITDAGETAVTIKLTAPITASITIAKGQNITLDLNGQTLTCETGEDTITNEGTLVIVSSVEDGTVMGGTVDTASGRTALLNKQGAVCTLKSGALKRGDVQRSGYYTVDNDGTLYMTGGEISNDSNSSSLVRNRGTMNITGGLVRQDSFIALKNDEDTNNGIVGKLTIGGSAVIQSAGEQAVQNWGEATIEAGSITGEVFSWSYTGVNSKLDIKGGNIEGDVAGIDFEANKKSTASVSISGGTVTGLVVVGNYSDGKVVSVEPNETSAKMEISGGAYKNDVSKFVAKGSSELVKASGGSRYQVGQYTSSTQGVTAAAQLNGKSVYFEALNDAVTHAGVTGVTVTADATLTKEIPEDVNVTVLGGATLTAQGDLTGVTFSDGAKLVVPEGQTATVGGKKYASGSYEAQKDGTLSKPETKPEEKPAEPAAPAPAPEKANPKTGVAA